MGGYVIAGHSEKYAGDAYTQDALIIREVVEHSVTFDAVPRVASLTVDGIAYSPSQLPMNLTWVDGTKHALGIGPDVPVSNGTRYVFDKWGDGGISASREVYAQGNAAYLADFRTQYYLAVSSEYGAGDGEGWYDAGSSASFSVAPTAVDHGNGTRHLFAGWRGSLTTNSTAASVDMDSPKAVTATWRTQYYLDVRSDRGETGGAGWYDAGTDARASVDAREVAGFPYAYTFVGWSGDASGTDVTSEPILMEGPKAATALWGSRITMALYLAVGLAAVVAAAGAVLLLRRRGSR
jgi:hypothetical protein